MQDAADAVRADPLARRLLELAVGFVNVPAEELDAAIEHTLGTIGRLSGVGRTYLFSYDWEDMTCTNTHEWCAPGVAPMRHLLQRVDTGGFRQFTAAHLEGREVYRPDTTDPALDAEERAELAQQGVRALLALPLMLHGSCVGFVGFDDVHGPRRWSEQDRELLRILAQLLAHAEERRSMERIRQVAVELAAANEQLNAFAGVVSHDLKVPLTTIKGLLSLLRSERVPVEQRGAVLAQAERAADRMDALIDQLLDYATAGREIGQPVPVELDRVVTLALEQLAGSVEQVGAHVDVERLPAVLGDELRLVQVVQNLVANALLHAQVDRRPQIVLRGHRTGEVVSLSIADNGPGIPAEERARVLRSFERGPDAAAPGVGMGLPLCARIVAVHGGSLELGDSVLGGLLVTLRLPAAPVT